MQARLQGPTLPQVKQRTGMIIFAAPAASWPAAAAAALKALDGRRAASCGLQIAPRAPPDAP